MISSEYIYLLIFVLLSRLPFYFSENKINAKDLVIKIIIQVFPLLFFIREISVFVLGIILVSICILEYIYENRFHEKYLSYNSIRMIELIVVFVFLTIVYSVFTPSGVSTNFNPIFYFFEKKLVITKDLKTIDYNSIGIVLLGFLYLINEANLPIRIILLGLKVIPKDERSNRDEGELKAGRVIGVFERIILYIFVIGGQYAALGLILAAKAYARSKRMDDQDFAEYVLIGTLISTSFALIVGLVVKYLIGF